MACRTRTIVFICSMLITEIINALPFLGSDLFLSTFYLEKCKVYSSLNAGYHFSHSYKTLGRIIVLCILNLVVLDSGRDGSDRIIVNYISIILTSRVGNYSSWLYSHRNIDVISLHSTSGVCFVNGYTHSSEQVGIWKAAF